MKKSIFAVAVAGMTLCGLTAFAQVPATQVAGKATPATAVVNDSPAPVKKSPFDGLNLTAAQKTKLEALHAQQAAERKQAMEQKKAKSLAAKQQKMAERKQAAEKRKARLTAAKQQKMAERAKRDSVKRQAKLNYLHKVKEILTPQQYVAYLENIAVGKDAVMGRPAVQPGKRDGKMYNKARGDKNKQFDKSQRPRKGVKPNGDGKK